MNKFSDQIAYRAAAYVDALGVRDASPSKAARFAAIRYLHLMREYREKLKLRYDGSDLETLKRVARSMDLSNPDNYAIFWARVCNENEKLGQDFRWVPLVFVDALVDLIREEDNAYRSSSV